MAKIKYQTIAQIEFDTDTGQQRLIKSFTKLLGQGNGQKYKKKQKTVESTVDEEEM